MISGAGILTVRKGNTENGTGERGWAERGMGIRQRWCSQQVHSEAWSPTERPAPSSMPLDSGLFPWVLFRRAMGAKLLRRLTDTAALTEDPRVV